MKILYIEDNPAHVELTRRSLESYEAEFDFHTAPNVQEAFSLLKTTEFDVILSDHRLPDGSGLDVIQLAHEQKITTAIVLITNQEDINTAIAALKAGAVDYVVKESDYLHRLPIVLRNAYSQTQLEKQKIALHESENRYRNIFESAVEGIFQSTLDGRFITVNPAMAKIFGYDSPDEMLQTVTDVGRQIHVSSESRRKFVAELISKGAVTKYEVQNIRKDGTKIWTSTNARVVKDKNGDIIYFEGFLTNITDRKIAELAREESENKYQVLIERFPGVVFLDDFYDSHVSRYMSPRIKELLGYTPEEWDAGEAMWENGLHPEDRERILAEDKRTDETGEPFQVEYRMRRKDGRYIWIRESSYLIHDQAGNPIYWQGILLDITSQKEAREAIRESEERFASVFHSSPIAICITSLDDGRFIDANHAYWELSGFQPEEILGKNIVDLNIITPAEREKFLAQLNQDKSIKAMDDQFVDKSGKAHNVLAFYESVVLGGEKCIVSMYHDVTEQKKAEQAIKVSENSYRGLFNSISQAIYIQDKDGCFLDVNDGATAMYGYPRDYFIGKTPKILSAPEKNDLNELVQKTKRAYQGEPQRFEFWGLRSDGRVFPKDVSLNKGTYFGKDVIIAVAQDITERKQTEIKLERQLKELTVLHATSVAGSQSNSEDEIIEQITRITASIYTDVCGVLLLNSQSDVLTPHPSYCGADINSWQSGYSITEGITGKAVTTARSVRVNDITKDPAYIRIASGVRSELCVPIWVHERIIGVFNVESRQANAFDEEDERLLNTIAGGLGTALEKLRLFKAEQAQSQREAAILDLIRTAASSLDLNQVLQSILNQLVRLIPSESGTIQLLDKEHLNIVAAIGFEGTVFAEQGSIKLCDMPLNNSVINEKQPIRIDDVRLNAQYKKIPIDGNIKSFLALPLISKGEAIGMITLESYKLARFTEQDAEMGLAIANHASIAIENAQLFETEKKRRQQAETLHKATEALTTSIKLDELFEIVFDSLSELVPYDSASIEMSRQDLFEIVAGRNILAELIGEKYKTDIDKWGGAHKLRQPVIIADVQMDDRFEKLKGSEYIRGWMGIPLFSQGDLIGYLNLDSRTPGFFNEEQAAIAQTFANQAAVAIENARLFQEERHRTKIIEALANIANEIAATREVIPALDKIAERALDLLNAITVAIYLLQDDDKTIKIVAAQGAHREELMSHSIKIGEGITGNIIASGKPEIIDDITKNMRRIRVPGTSEEDTQLDTMMSVPLISRGKTIGAINAWRLRSNGLFKTSELNFLVNIAHQASISIESGNLFQETIRRSQEAAAIAEVGRDISATLQLDVVLERIAMYAKDLLKAETSAVYLTEPNSPLLRAISAIGIESQEIKNFPLQTGKGILGNIALQKHGEIVNNTADDPRTIIVDGTDIKYDEHIMGVPVLSKNQLTGLLVVWRTGPGEKFKTTDLDFLSSLAQQAAVAIENARLFQEESRRSQIIEALANIANEMAATREVIPALDKMAQRALSLLRASTIAVYLLQEDKKNIKIVSAQGAYQKELISHTITAGEGITGNIIEMGKPEIVDDITKDPRKITVPGTPEEDDEQDTMMSAPLVLHGESIGAINAWRLRSSGLFDKSELNFLVSIAHQASISIESVRLFEETMRRAQEAAAIAEVGRDISATLQLDIVLERIATYAKDLLNANTSAVYLSEPNSPFLRAIAATGHEADEIKNDPLQMGMGILGNIALQKHGEIVNNTIDDPRTITVKGTNILLHEHIMGVPVFSNNQLTGLLVVWRIGIDKEYKATELDFLSSLAQQAAVAIENARLFQEEQMRRQEAENLQVAATALTSSLDPQEVLETILVALKQVVPYDSASVFLLEGDKIRITAAKGLPNIKDAVNKVFPASNVLLSTIQDTMQPLIIEDAQVDIRFEKWVAADFVRGWMGVPLIARGAIIGLITLDSRTTGAFGANSALLAQTFAHQATAAIENARLYAETRRRLEEQEVISQLSFSLRVAKNSQEMLYLLLNQILKAMNTNTAAIWLYDPVKNELMRSVAKGWLLQIPKPNFKPGDGIVGHVFSSGELHISQYFNDDPLAHPENSGAFGKDWGGLTLPIRTTTDVIGVLVVSLPGSRPIEQHHTKLLSTIAEIAGNAIQRVSLFEQSERQVQRLTALREIDTAIASSFDLKITLNILANHIITQMGASAACVLLYNADEQLLNYLVGTGFRTNLIFQTSLQIGTGFAGKVLLERKDVFIEQLPEATKSTRNSLFAQEGFVSYCAIPLISKGIAKGVLEVYFRQPFTNNLDWMGFLHVLAGQATIAIDNAQLFENLQRSNQDLSLAYDTTLEGWGKALELRDKETQGHTRRVTDLTIKLAREMGLSEAKLVQIRRGVLLHDIGKMGIPDNILRKKGPLTKKEWKEMRKHPQYAYDLLSSIPYLQSVIDIPYSHHEWWDGSGYPRGLKGDGIPLPARIFAVVDVWDALLSERSYRKPWSRSKVIKYLKEQSGIHFDPDVIKVFLNMIKNETK